MDRASITQGTLPHPFARSAKRGTRVEGPHALTRPLDRLIDGAQGETKKSKPPSCFFGCNL